MKEDIIKYDKGFTEEAFIKYAVDVFNALIISLMNFNISPLAPYLDESIYNKYVDLIEGYKKMRIKRIFSDIIFKNKVVQSYTCNEKEIRIKLLIVTKYKDVFIHENGEPVNEGNGSMIEKGHYITFVKDLTNRAYKYVIKEMSVI